MCDGLSILTMSEVLTINRAARELGKSASTVRRWVQRGCPCVRPGEVGRGKGAILNLQDVITWRGGGGVFQASDDERLEFLAGVLMDVLRRDEIHERIGITASEMAGMLVLIYERYHKNLTHEPVDRQKLPPEIAQLLAIYVR